MLLASLRTDGSPATIDGVPTGLPTMVADRAPERPRLAALRSEPAVVANDADGQAPETSSARPALA
ncbi:MAG: septal ring lytic transglycosylase RlpA family protein, partial [Hyphomicrobiales bacterium]|nr:septal ring lytic transglycosylase RlpA family protein [Hyphomicrobiales bacterium]